MDESGVDEELIPEFVTIHFNVSIFNWLEKTLLKEFIRQFRLLGEQAWTIFLNENMPSYKHSAPEPSDRKMPFAIDSTMKNLLSMGLNLLENCEIEKYVKLDNSSAKMKINNFKHKYSLTSNKSKVQIDKLTNAVREGLKTFDEQANRFYQFLFVIFTELMEEKYNGIIRQLCKEFLKAIEPACRSLLNINSQQPVGYLIAIFESYIVDQKVPRDKFDLVNMRPVLLTDEQTKKMNLSSSLTGTKICELERISDKSVKSKHIIICVTGFLQEDQNKGDFWHKLVEYYKHAEIYAMSWQACTPTTFLTGGTFGKQDDSSLRKQHGQQAGLFQNLLNFEVTAKRQFIFAVDQARVAGTLLAMFLTKSNFAENRAITLIGFSLGGVVSFNCMKILKRLNDYQNPKAGKLINDVQIWAGAYVLDLNKEYQEVLEKSVNCTVVNGHMNNLYSTKDVPLAYGFPKLFKGKRAIGLYAIFEDIKEEDQEGAKLATNYNVTKDSPGHGSYSECCKIFLEYIEGAF